MMQQMTGLKCSRSQLLEKSEGANQRQAHQLRHARLCHVANPMSFGFLIMQQ